MNQKEVLDMAASAKRLPSRQAEFENLVLNRRVEAKSPFVSQTVWHMNKDEPGELAGATVWGRKNAVDQALAQLNQMRN